MVFHRFPERRNQATRATFNRRDWHIFILLEANVALSDDRTGPVGRISWLLRSLFRQIWVRASLFCIAAVIVALLAAYVGPHLPFDPGLTLASGSVDAILEILASSMLAVTIFSLSIMVAAYSSASTQVTPRSVKLLLADPTAQNTLSTFVGSFLFSIVGIIGLTADLYRSNGRVLLFFATLIVIIIVVTALLRWIDHLGRFGRVGETILRVEESARTALEDAARRPNSGACAPVTVPETAIAIRSKDSGHLQHTDIAKLDKIATAAQLTIHVAVLPGALVHPRQILMHVEPCTDAHTIENLYACFSIGKRREFDSDPAFGVIVLSEIASRALSPAVNDPGTAIEVADTGLRLFLAYGDASKCFKPAPAFKRIHVPSLEIANLIFSFFNPIARDGAAIVEVQLRLIEVLAALSANQPDLFGAAARVHGRSIIDRSDKAMASPQDQARLALAAQTLLNQI